MTEQKPRRRKDDHLDVTNRRRDAMFAAAYIAVCSLVYIVVESTLTEYAQGVITLALGNFLGFLTAMYNYETGSTRGSAAKDATITDMTKAAATTADTPVVTPAPTTPEGIVPAAEVAKPKAKK